jgi:predicted GNAT family acetyltransferase
VMDVLSTDHVNEAVRGLEREPLRNVVLLKQIEAFREHVSLVQLSTDRSLATLVLLDTSASAYDRETYPRARFSALISSDDPALTRHLVRSVPARDNVVFKLARDGDRDVVAEHFAISRATSFLSFTGDEHTTFTADGQASILTSASESALRLFESQGHPRDWLLPLLASGRAFACVLEQDGEPRSACIAFANHRQIWEVGGVVTPMPHRGQGFAARVVRTALAELQRRKLVARYQVNEDNLPSIRLATSVGLRQFLQLTHFRTW